MRVWLFFLLLVPIVFNLSCGSTEKAASEPEKLVSSLSSRFVASSGSIDTLLRFDGPRDSRYYSDVTAQTTLASLTSLKYFITSISLCQEMNLSESGYSSATGCITIYQTADTSVYSIYNTYSISEALNDTIDSHFFDLLTEKGRAKLVQTKVLAASDVGTYRYGRINVMRPVKITGSFFDPASNELFFTKTPKTSEIVALGNDSAGRKIESVVYSTTDTTSPDPSELTLMNSNGETWFAFARPLELTATDIADGIALDVRFAFNPDQFASAVATASCGAYSSSSPTAFDETNCVTFSVPMAKFAAVPIKTSEKLTKEIYVSDFSSASGSESNLRIELYYSDSDSARTVLGVDVTAVTKETATSVTGAIQALTVSEKSSVVTIYGYNSATDVIDLVTLTGLTRGVAGTLTLTCTGAGAFGSDCTAKGKTVSRAYTYVGTKIIN